MDFKEFFPLFALVLGWGLSEFSSILRSRGDKKKTLSKVLSELLEIHHSLVGRKIIAEELKKRSGLDIENVPELKKLISNIVDHDLPGVTKRYSEAVEMLAAYDPLLAFKLRNKDKVSPLIARLSDLGKGDHEAEIILNTISEKLEERLVPVLEEAALGVAKRLDWFSARSTKKILESKKGLVDSIFESFRELLPKGVDTNVT